MVASLLAYVGLNLLYINFATIIHRVSFQVIVVDAATGDPVPAADVGWHCMNPHGGQTWVREIGKTDMDGRLGFEEVIQQQPRWLWPIVGEFRFHPLTLRITAPEYVEQLVPLGEAMPDVPLSKPEGLVHVTLARRVEPLKKPR